MQFPWAVDSSRALTVAILLMCNAFPARAVEWAELGPAPITTGGNTGRVAALAISPVDDNTWFIGGADGGVWRTTDSGVSWTPLTDDMPTTAIGAIAIDPQHANTVYVGTGEANYANHSRYGLGIYRSLDGGETWEHFAESTFAGRCFSRLLVHPTNSAILYGAVTRAGGFPELAAAKNHPQATDPVGVYRSSDGGETWTYLSNGLPNLSATDLAIDSTNPSVLYAAIGRIFGDAGNGIYKSTDGGDSWTKLTSGLPAGASCGRISLDLAPSLPNRLYAMITRPADAAGGGASTLGVYRSNDSGATWSQLAGFGNIQATYGWYLSVVTVHPTNPDLVWFGGLNLRRTTTGGSNWETANPPHVDVHAIEWTSDGQRLIIADDGGIHESPTGGGFWQIRNTGLGLIQFYAGISTHPDLDEVLLGGTQDNGTNRRNETGINWFASLGGDGGWTQIDQVGPTRAFAEFQGSGNLYRSGNAGQSFPTFSGGGISMSDRNAFLPPYVIDPNDNMHMLYGTQRIYESVTGGTVWTPISGDLTNGAPAAIRSIAIAPSNSNVVYVATNDSRVLRSDDGGANFILLLDDNLGWPRVTRELFVHPDDAMTVYLAGNAFGVEQLRRSTDGGETWQALDATLPDIPVNVVTVDTRGPRDIIFLGTDAGLLRSTDDGATWYAYGDFLPNVPVVDLILEPARGRLTVATQGRGTWQIPIGLLGDMNCDGFITVSDIGFFVTALTDPTGYEQLLPECLLENADIDGNREATVSDIGGFIELLLAE
ncbi:MAG: WD40/YVTN/BNR-like repeat-containing protein [Phycisphaerae bacterium]